MAILQEWFADDAFGTGTALSSGAAPNNCTPGSTIEVWCSVSNFATAPTLSDSATQSYGTNKGLVYNAVTGGAQQLSLFVLQNNASATKLNVTMTFGAAQSGKAIWCREVGGVSATSYNNSNLTFIQAPGTGANSVQNTAISPSGYPVFCSAIAMEDFIGNGSDLASGTGFTLDSAGWAYGTGTVLAKTSHLTSNLASGSQAALYTAATNGTRGTYLVGLAMYNLASGGGNVTVGITGSSFAFTAGAWIPAHSQAVAGSSFAFSSGTANPGTSPALTGLSVASAAGLESPSDSPKLTGSSASFSPGTGVASISGLLSGISAAFSGGVLSPSLLVPIAGSQATFTTGAVSAGGSVTANLTGSSMSMVAGSLVPSLALALSGQLISTSLGLLAPSAQVGLAGSTIASSSGTLIPSLVAALVGSGMTFSSGSSVPGLGLGLVGQSVGSTSGSSSPSDSVPLVGQNANFATGILTQSGGTPVGGQTLPLVGFVNNTGFLSIRQ